MKRRIFSIFFALVLVLSLGLVMAAPVAATVSTPAVVVNPTEISEPALYTITFTTAQDLTTFASDEIYIEFPVNTTVPSGAFTSGHITVDGTSVVTAAGSAQLVTILVPENVAAGPVTVVFTIDADITNPSTAGTTYTLDVSTSQEFTVVPSSAYSITLPPPTVGSVAPPLANQGETLDIVIGGNDFTGATAVSFGSGITVDSFTVDAIDAITASITIDSAATIATRDVSVTTAAGTGTSATSIFAVQAAGTELVDIYDINDDYRVGESESTIAAALTAAATGETLKLHVATYTESGLQQDSGTSIIIQSLTGELTGTGSAADTTISADLSADHDYILAAAQASGDLTVKGLTITNTHATPASTGVATQTSGTNGTGDVSVENCVVSNFNWGVSAYGTGGGAVSITDSTISDNNFGVGMWEAGTSLTLTGSTIIDNLLCGVVFEQDHSGVDTLITKNTFQDNNSTAIGAPAAAITFNSAGKIGAAWSLTNSISYNNFINNGFAIENGVGDPVPAQFNWWGDISGPSCGDADPTDAQASTALGSGDAILDKDTAYDPWLTVVQATAVSEGVAYHGSTYPLEAGWNTLSVPLALDDGADTMADIVALGDFIISDPEDPNQNYLGGYYYDAVNGLWVELPGAYEFAPCKAVYVNMAEIASFPVLYSGVFSLPSLSLPDGWNLVGSAFGIDISDDYGIAAHDTVGDGQKTVGVALASLGASASVVISPSMPGQEGAWASTDGSETMCVGEGYWVFLTAPATLAGFEVTPIYKIFLP